MSGPNQDAKLIERIEALIANATDKGNTEEARRSYAVEACRLIRQSGYRVVTATDFGALQRQRPAIPIVDISLDDMAKSTREGIADEVTGIAERFAKDGFSGVVDWFKNANEVIPHAKFRATRDHTCAKCLERVRRGEVVIAQVGDVRKGQERRVTCTKPPCVASWTGL